jgi:DNA modification methylase
MTMKDRVYNPLGRNRRSVWTVSTAPFPGAHFATFPPKLIEPCILAGCPIGGTVLDCFGGSGTVGMVAENNSRNSILIELNPKYIEMIRERTRQQNLFAMEAVN